MAAGSAPHPDRAIPAPLGRALLRARHAEEQRHREVREALASVRTLCGLLPLCAWCRRIRSDAGYWEQLEAYVTNHSDATITHGMCPDCARKHVPEATDADAVGAGSGAPGAEGA